MMRQVTFTENKLTINGIRSFRSETDLKIEVIKYYYKNGLSEEYLNDVIRWFKEQDSSSL